MQQNTIIFQSKKFKLYGEGNGSFMPGKDLAIFLIQKLLDHGLHLGYGLKDKNADFEEMIDETCYCHFELQDDPDILEFIVILLRAGTPLQDYWSIQFNKHISFRKSIFKPEARYCFNPDIITKLETVVREIGDVENLQRLTDAQFSAFLVA